MACELGKAIRQKEFYHSEDYGFTNHGSWGTVPRRVLDVQKRYLEEVEQNVDHWFRRSSDKYVNAAKQAAADFLGANVANINFVENATRGLNSILKSIPLSPGDAILATNFTYNAVANACRAASAKSQGTEVVAFNITFPISSREAFIKNYTDFLDAHKNIKVAVIDVISSFPSMLLPWKELTAACRERGILACLDGAHVPGQLRIALEECGADFFVGNLHKWSFCPRGCAVIWVHHAHHHLVRPTVTSHIYDKKQPFPGDFDLQGTRDLTAYACVPDAIKFYHDIAGGWDEVVAHNCSLVERFTEDLVNALGTSQLQIPVDMRSPFMRHVKLPELPGWQGTQDDAVKLMDTLYEKGVIAAVGCIEDELWLRIGAHVYNTPEDYERLKSIVLEMAEIK